jgi:RimJ/RimL family protein N-acetyltransferase
VDLNQQHPLYGFYAVSEKILAQPIGLAKFVKMDEQEAEVGYAVSPDFWRKGYGSEITQAIIQYAKNHTSLKTLIALINPENEASFQLLLKHDFHFSHSIKEKENKISHAYALALKA